MACSLAYPNRRIKGSLLLAAAAAILQGNVGLTTNLDARLLAAHNRERLAHGVERLHWDEELAADAARWGAYLGTIDNIEHDPGDPDDSDPQGENLFLGTKAHFAAEAMVGAWIAEKKHFKPGRFPDNSRTGDFADVGHYTQLMWRETGRVGCAVNRDGAYDILVCRYATAGNVEGERPF